MRAARLVGPSRGRPSLLLWSPRRPEPTKSLAGFSSGSGGSCPFGWAWGLGLATPGTTRRGDGAAGSCGDVFHDDRARRRRSRVGALGGVVLVASVACVGGDHAVPSMQESVGGRRSLPSLTSRLRMPGLESDPGGGAGQHRSAPVERRRCISGPASRRWRPSPTAGYQSKVRLFPVAHQVNAQDQARKVAASPSSRASTGEARTTSRLPPSGPGCARRARPGRNPWRRTRTSARGIAARCHHVCSCDHNNSPPVVQEGCRSHRPWCESSPAATTGSPSAMWGTI